jgi:hypothetical protein
MWQSSSAVHQRQGARLFSPQRRVTHTGSDSHAPAAMWWSVLRLSYLLAADRVQQHCISLSATIFLPPCPIRAGRAFQTLPAACHTLVTTCACRHMAATPRATLAADRVQPDALPHASRVHALRFSVTRSACLTPVVMCWPHHALSWLQLIMACAATLLQPVCHHQPDALTHHGMKSGRAIRASPVACHTH